MIDLWERIKELRTTIPGLAIGVIGTAQLFGVNISITPDQMVVWLTQLYNYGMQIAPFGVALWLIFTGKKKETLNA